jgi:DNA polymerase IV
MSGFCRDCCRDVRDGAGRCMACGSPRLLRHAELDTLAIAHVDCDAFYATIEKRDDPSLADKPVIVGGRERGVVLTACYVARTFGVKSAMPMFEARRLCPHAAVVRPDMAKYARAGREVRSLMSKLTPLVEPVSIDEAFMDLSGTARLHATSPAKALAAFAVEVEKRVGITVSIGLSCNKFLAKIASDLDKPRGFAVLGRGEAAAFLASQPVTLIFGVGKMAQQRLARDGLRTIGDLQRAGERELLRRYGAEGARLAKLAQGMDDRPVSARLKHNALAGSTVALKLKTADFRIRTRAQSLAHPTQLATRIFDTARNLLVAEVDGTMFRLLGVGVSALSPADGSDFADLIDRRAAETEQAIDRLREKFGKGAIIKGLAFGQEDG